MSHPFYVAHATDGRTRIRWAGEASEKSGIIEIAENIAGVTGVDQALPRLATGSIIVEHDQTDWSALEPRLVNELSLEIILPPKSPGGLQTLNLGLDKVDERLKGMDTDLPSVTVLLLIILAITQALRGQVMGNSMSFLWYALSVATMARGTPSPQMDATTDIAD